MTTELEKEFYKVFGLKPFCDLPCNKRGVECTDNTYCGNKYSDITAEKLLEMICIYNSTYTNGYTNYSLLTERNVEKLKEQILKNCLIVRDDIKQQIQQLFK